VKREISSGEAQRFDQKNTIYARAAWDPAVKEFSRGFYGGHVFGERPGYTLKDFAFAQAAWYLERQFGKGSLTGNFGLTQWRTELEEVAEISRIAPGQKYSVSDPAKMSQDMKKVARFLGASVVGICRLEKRWLYSHRFDRMTSDYSPIEIPEELQHVIVMAHEMDYELTEASPALLPSPRWGKPIPRWYIRLACWACLFAT